MLERLEGLRVRAIAEVEVAGDKAALESWRLAYLGRKGALTLLLRSIGGLPQAERRAAGAAGNQVKAELEAALERKQAALEATARAAGEPPLDVTLPGRASALGGLHPTTLMLRRICRAFTALGFQVVEGPEVEWDYYNFEALNIPKDHPARDMWSTFWVDFQNKAGERPMLLRTHTSPMQVRVMEKARPPIRVVIPGRCYRYEATDATHESIFFQVEGLAVDQGITMADLKGTLYEFARHLFGPERKVRFRCDYFPFVEPGVEMAIDCFACGGAGCRVCSGTGWVEIMGAGMVHPHVLKRVGYDPKTYTGFAFGLGVERIAMLQWGINDIRLFYGNDLRFLKQFRQLV